MQKQQKKDKRRPTETGGADIGGAELGGEQQEAPRKLREQRAEQRVEQMAMAAEGIRSSAHTVAAPWFVAPSEYANANSLAAPSPCAFRSQSGAATCHRVFHMARRLSTFTVSDLSRCL